MTLPPRLSQSILAKPGLYLGLGLTLIYIPNVTGIAILTGWAFLAVALPLFLWKRQQPTALHWIGLSFLVWTTLSLAWTENIYDSLGALAQWYILGMAFCVGASIDNTRNVYFGICFGLCFAVTVALAQSFGWTGVWQPETYHSNVTGLFVNSTAFGCILALALTVAMFENILWFIPIGGLGLFLTGARGPAVAFVVAAMVGIFAKSKRLFLVLLVPFLLFGAAVYVNKPGTIDYTLRSRLVYWLDTAEALTPLGKGVGSFFQTYPTIAKRTNTSAIRPDHAYNDILEVTYELGIGAAVLWLLLILSMEAPLATEHLVLLAFGVEATIYFPLALPITAFLGAFAAGRLAHSRALVRSGVAAGRPAVPDWMGDRFYGRA